MRARLLAAVAAGATVLLLPSVAQAATAFRDSFAGWLEYRASAGEINAVRVFWDSSALTVRIRDHVIITAGPGCRSISAYEVACRAPDLILLPNPDLAPTSMLFRLGDRDDSLLHLGDWTDVLGYERIHAGEGNDTISAGPSNDRVMGGSGDDVLHGWLADDVLQGEDGRDALYGQEGADALVANPSSSPHDDADYFSGGTGLDAVNYDLLPGTIRSFGVTVAIDGLANDGGPTEHDNVDADVEDVVGTPYADVLAGGPAANQLTGRDGDDRISGGLGQDRLKGDNGNDIISAVDRAWDGIDGGDGYDKAYADVFDSTWRIEWLLTSP